MMRALDVHPDPLYLQLIVLEADLEYGMPLPPKPEIHRVRA